MAAPEELQVVTRRLRPLHEDAPTNGSSPNGNGRPRPLPTIGGKVVDPEQVSAEVEAMSAPRALAWAIETFGPRLGFAVSFQKTTSVIVDIAHGIDPGARFFYIDTELFFPETYATRDALAEHFDIEFVFRGFGHLMKLAGVVAVIDHIAGDNQLVLVIDGDLDIVARHDLTVLGQQPGIRIASRQLRLAALLQPRQIGL